MTDTVAIQQNCKFISNASKFASIKAKNFLDLNMIEKGVFKPLMSPISLHDISRMLIRVLDSHFRSKSIQPVLFGDGSDDLIITCD